MPNQYTGALINVPPKTIFDRYLADEKIADIAASYNVSRSNLNYFLIRYAQDEWQQIQAIRAITSLEKAKDDLENASDALSLSRAREQLKAAQWDLERLLRRVYGNEVTVNINQSISIQAALEEAKGRIIEVGSQPIADAQSSAALPET